MGENLAKLIETSEKMIQVADDLLRACHRKEKKVCSQTRYVISFFLRRSSEMFESFLLLVKENRIIDAALLLRSLWEMGISLGYIFAKDIDETESEKRALRYLLDGDRQQLKLVIGNLDGFREFDPNIEKRRDILEGRINEMEGILKQKYKEKKWKLPSIEQRSKLSNYEVLRNAYNQAYRGLSNIEHHSYLFGDLYVDGKRCEPKRSPDHLKRYPQYKLEVSLFQFRLIFIEFLNVFNREFRLGHEKQLEELNKSQDEEYELLKG